ncbi:hypothetical protein TYRP_019349 [Tyrophagus putrescentiae]|nr:hypothetical protein TYRP_019349 [Tyrophagus putrescentiae]
MSSDILSPRRSNSRDSTTSPSNSSSIITVMETDFPPRNVARGSYSSSSSSSANHSTTRHRSVESANSTTNSHHQDSTESSSSLKSPCSAELNGGSGGAARKYQLPPKLPDIGSASSHLVDSAIITIEPADSPGIIPTPPPPPTSSKPSLSCDHHHHHHNHHHHHHHKKKPSISKFKFPNISSPHSEDRCSPEDRTTAAEARERESIESASSPSCSPKEAEAAGAPKVDCATQSTNYKSRDGCTAGSVPVCEIARASGLKSKKLKPLVHPLDRSIVGIFTLTIFFTILAILTGAPIVFLLFCLIPFVLLFKKLFLCHFSDILHHEPLSSIDSFWIHREHVAHCVLHVDKGLSVQQLRDVISSRVLTKAEFKRFKSRLVYKGLCNVPYWKYDSEWDAVDEHVVEDEDISSKGCLRLRIMKLMSTPLPMDRPLWQVLYSTSTYCNQVILIIRVHQALSQSGLVSILTHYLSDSVPISSTTKPRFGGVTLSINIFRAIIVGPLTFFLWILWAFTRRHHNHLTKAKEISSVHWMTLDLARVYRIKQVTRSSLNDVLLSSVAGTLRAYLTTKTCIKNPPDLTVSIPIDIRPTNPIESSLVGVNYVLTTSPIPTNTEGAIPRLWEVRHLMEELKTSADTAVMYGAHYLLNRLLPRPLYRALLNLVNRNSSIYVSNIQGPETELSIGSHRLVKAYYFLSPPSYCSIVFNIFTMHQKLYLSISSQSKLISNARALSKLFRAQIDLLHVLLSRRRVPGESKRAKRAMFLGPEAANHLQAAHAGMYQNIAGQMIDDSTSGAHRDLSGKLHSVQDELNRLSEAYDMGEPGVAQRYEELKDEFTSLLFEMRRRKSIADYGVHGNITINIENEEDDDNDGELRPPPRRFSVVSIGRRGSLVSTLPSSSRVTPPILSRRSMAATSPEPPSSPEVAFKIETEC